MKKFAATFGLILVCGWCYALPTNDDFNSASEDTTNWASDLVTQQGVLTQTNQHLEFRVTGTPTVFDQSVRPWKPSKGPYTSDWEVQVDTFNIAQPIATNQQVATGITIDDARGISSNEVIAVQFAGGTGAGTQIGFIGRLGGLDSTNYVTAIPLPVTNGAVRVTFNSTNKVFTLYYDTNSSNGLSWTQFGSFGINGSGGADANMSWGLSDTDQIKVGVYGFAENTVVSSNSNEVALDNFASIGLVAPLEPHDLAITAIKAPKSIALSAKKPSVTKKATVTIKNMGPLTEQITAANVTNLVDFELTSLAPATCTAPVPVLILPKKLPINLSPKKSLSLSYNITFNCANNPGKRTNDFSYAATVHVEAIDGNPDTQSSNDDCPRGPSGSDKGCGGKNPDHTLGAGIFTDVTVKP